MMMMPFNCKQVGSREYGGHSPQTKPGELGPLESKSVINSEEEEEEEFPSRNSAQQQQQHLAMANFAPCRRAWCHFLCCNLSATGLGT